ncbi:DUF3304 domain-containing protein [Glaciimonas immobilis]|uniref:DUF3304 domain-containing protein n=1 Tax=Glaciimonas immobilis TaxID=728004 RepID=A0A840RWU0_9BURK|nr:DUF3304 domain-containing protein [Glaciimonas immobilis]KAF3996744.1 DUF3304 domain-containing protein [Glaciimonas immobilis]MBB5201336.1 hypothetical protein [Glaciimonas immobilis]
MRIQNVLLIAVIFMLSACATKTSKPARPLQIIPYVDIAMAPVSIGCLSHDGAPYIYSFSVEEFYSKRMVGGLSCGGTGAFGYMLPMQWHSGMKVKVRWNRPIKGEDYWIEKTTSIRRYDMPGTLFVHFFANDEVRVVSSPLSYPQSPKHPILNSVTVAPPEEE